MIQNVNDESFLESSLQISTREKKFKTTHLNLLFEKFNKNDLENIIKFLKEGASSSDDYTNKFCIEAFKLPVCRRIYGCPSKPVSIDRFGLLKKFKCEICENFYVDSINSHLNTAKIIEIIDQNVHEDAKIQKQKQKEQQEAEAIKIAEAAMTPNDKFLSIYSNL